MSYLEFPLPEPIENKRQRVSEIPTRRGSLGSALFILSAVAATLAVPSASYAATIQAAEVQVGANGQPTLGPGGIGILSNQTTIFTVGAVSGSGTGVPGFQMGNQTSFASASYAGGAALLFGNGSTFGATPPGPPVTPPPPGSAGIAEVTFFFVIIGSAPGVTSVPILTTATATTTVTGPTSEAFAGLRDPDQDWISACSATGADVANLESTGQCNGIANISATTSTVTQTLQSFVTPGVQYNEAAQAFGQTINANGSWLANLDPQVQIDPTFAQASSFSIVFSPDLSVIPPATTPEPSSLILLGSGLLGLIGAMRRKRLA